MYGLWSLIEKSVWLGIQDLICWSLARVQAKGKLRGLSQAQLAHYCDHVWSNGHPRAMGTSLAELSLEYGQPYAHSRTNGSPDPISWLAMVVLPDEPTFWPNILIHAMEKGWTKSDQMLNCSLWADHWKPKNGTGLIVSSSLISI